MAGKPAFALLHAMRTGKTKILVDDWARLVGEGKAFDLLVIGPKAALEPWRAALEADLPEGLFRSIRAYTWASAKADTRASKSLREALLAETIPMPRVLLVNVEALSSVKAARELCLAFLGQRVNFNCLAVDESVCIKNPRGKAARFVVDALAPLAKYRRILTGLVSPQSPVDLYMQFKFLDPKILGHSTLASFQARYVRIKHTCLWPGKRIDGLLASLLKVNPPITRAKLQYNAACLVPGVDTKAMSDGQINRWLHDVSLGMPRDAKIDAVKRLGGWVDTVPLVEGYQNVDELQRRIAPFSDRVTLDDVYDMPASDYSFRDVEMTTDQRRVYDEMKAFATARLSERDHVTASEVVTQILRLHQVLMGHVPDESGKIHDIKENRTRALLDILRDYEGKAVIWVSYDLDVKKVAAAIVDEFKPTTTAHFAARFWGGNAATRETEEMLFRNNPDCRFMVATPDAGGKGRDWSVADLVIYYSNRDNLDHRLQSEERVKAAGKTRPIAYVDLRCPGTVDEKIVAALRDKLNLSRVIQGDDWRSWLI